jgi:hypothetical protein
MGRIEMRKIAVVLISVPVTAALAVGCGSSSGSTSTQSTTAQKSSAQKAADNSAGIAVLTLNDMQQNHPSEYQTLCTSIKVDGYAKTFERLAQSPSLGTADAGAVADELQKRCASGEKAGNQLLNPSTVQFTCQNIKILGSDRARKAFVAGAPYGVSSTEMSHAFDQIEKRC